jgi:small subunit ribosomal protein S8
VTNERPQPNIRLWLKYDEKRRPIVTGLKRISRPGRRVYSGKHELPWVLSGLGIAIVSTPRGVMTDREARRTGVGGEILCYVW